VDGNGEKILRRLINYSRQHAVVIEDESFKQILQNWPGCRKLLLAWWYESVTPEKKLKLIIEFIRSGHIIDHITFIDLAISVVTARLAAITPNRDLIKELCMSFDTKKQWGFYALTWITSKYGTDDELFQVVDKGESVWSTNEHLSRTAASIYPRFIGKVYEPPFVGMMRRANIWARYAFQFQSSLSSTVDGVTSVKKFVNATNPSLPNRITHPKFLMLAGILKNSAVAPTLTASFRATHSWAPTDQYYSKIVQ
jgi:hypothetical protein